MLAEVSSLLSDEVAALSRAIEQNRRHESEKEYRKQSLTRSARRSRLLFWRCAIHCRPHLPRITGSFGLRTATTPDKHRFFRSARSQGAVPEPRKPCWGAEAGVAFEIHGRTSSTVQSMPKILSRPKIFTATFSKAANAVRPRFQAARPALLISMGHLMTGKMSRTSARAAATNAKSESCVEKTSISQTKSRLRIALVPRFDYCYLNLHRLRASWSD